LLYLGRGGYTIKWCFGRCCCWNTCIVFC